MIPAGVLKQQYETLCRHKLFLKLEMGLKVFDVLFNAALEQKILSVETVALKVYGKADIEDAANVRSHSATLRGKLLEYYTKHGQQDRVVFTLEKGPPDHGDV